MDEVKWRGTTYPVSKLFESILCGGRGKGGYPLSTMNEFANYG